MPTDLFDRLRVIDVDTHLTEPPDVWTARMPTSLHDDVPHIERIDGRDVWMAGGTRLGMPGYFSMAGHDGVMPLSVPNTFDDIPKAMFDPQKETEHHRDRLQSHRFLLKYQTRPTAVAAITPSARG